MPILDKSEYVMMLGFLKTILSMEVPAVAESSNSSHIIRS